MRTTRRLVLASAVIGIALVTTERKTASQEFGAVSIAAGHADLDALRRWDATVDGMARTGDLVAVSHLNEPSVEGRIHDYLAQHYAGIPVHSGGVSRQLDRSGVTVSLFGTLHQGIFFRAMMHLMPAGGSFRIAAAVIRQSAADLAPGGDAERAVDQALRAVGLAPEMF